MVAQQQNRNKKTTRAPVAKGVLPTDSSASAKLVFTGTFLMSSITWGQEKHQNYPQHRQKHPQYAGCAFFFNAATDSIWNGPRIGNWGFPNAFAWKRPACQVNKANSSPNQCQLRCRSTNGLRCLLCIALWRLLGKMYPRALGCLGSKGFDGDPLGSAPLSRSIRPTSSSPSLRSSSGTSKTAKKPKDSPWSHDGKMTLSELIRDTQKKPEGLQHGSAYKLFEAASEHEETSFT